MPLTLLQAADIAHRALRVLASGSIDVMLLPEKTAAFDVGWVFYYQSVRFLETGSPSDSLAGNAPLFVARADGRTFFVSTHRSLSESMAVYRTCGNPNAVDHPQVLLTDWPKRKFNCKPRR
jgi:hypothetical protein